MGGNIFIAVLMGAVMALILTGMTSTGPNCPGMDPSWIGWCE